MGISGAVDWWEEWQLRIVVLGSLLVQWFLFFSAPQRKHAIHSWFRSLIWLAYLGSDAIAIYALANLFSRQRQDCSSGQANSILEVVWAPILLMHLGGYDTITAYNIEDNELWTRHVLTAVSQIIVAIYVFWKSWPGGDKRLLQVAILFFTPGILKCLMRPWALKRASINSLISYYDPSPRMTIKEGDINSLEEYVRKAGDFFQHYECQGQGEGNAVGLEPNHAPQAEGKGDGVDLEANRLCQAKGDDDKLELDPDHHPQTSSPTSFWAKLNEEEEEEKRRLRSGPYRLFVDRASSYSDRLSILQKLWVLNYMQAYEFLQQGLSVTFELLYTKISTGNAASEDVELSFGNLSVASMFLPFAAIGLFHKCNRDAYDVNDVKVTYALICCTAVLELLSYSFHVNESDLISSEMVSQYSLLSFFVRNKRHSKKMCLLSSFNCKDFLDQHWCMESCSSSSRITELVRQHVKVWWKHIVDAASYRRFNDHRGQWTIQHKGCDQDQEWGLDRPFDESVLLWHIATDLCFYQKGEISASHGNAEICREISNYMVYLLFVKPEMLLPGSNRNLFNTANAELEGILKDDKPLLEFLKRKGPSPEEIEKGLVDRIIAKLQPTECREEDPGCTKSPTNAEQYPTQEVFIQDALKISKALLDLGDDIKMWGVIEGVWVEMLCYAASRCRGYLHAKSLGSGGELLTYIWLLLSHMGMETLPERLQRTELPIGERNAGTPPSTSQIQGLMKLGAKIQGLMKLLLLLVHLHLGLKKYYRLNSLQKALVQFDAWLSLCVLSELPE